MGDSHFQKNGRPPVKNGRPPLDRPLPSRQITTPLDRPPIWTDPPPPLDRPPPTPYEQNDMPVKTLPSPLRYAMRSVTIFFILLQLIYCATVYYGPATAIEGGNANYKLDSNNNKPRKQTRAVKLSV